MVTLKQTNDPIKPNKVISNKEIKLINLIILFLYRSIDVIINTKTRIIYGIVAR